jgi:hypothetical protein
MEDLEWADIGRSRHKRKDRANREMTVSEGSGMTIDLNKYFAEV